MKKLVLFLLLLMGLVSMANAKYYECYRYVKGSPTGTWVKVKASNKDEASTKAYARFQELGGRVDSVNCHFKSK